MKRLTRALLVLAFGAALVAVLGERDAPRVARSATERHEPSSPEHAPGEAEVVVRVSSVVSPPRGDEASADPAAGVARALSALHGAARDRAELEAELLAAPRAELAAMRPRLEELLRTRPALAPAAARAFAKLDDREGLFVVSRALVSCGQDPEVRAALLAAAESGSPARREVALLALASARDEQALSLARSALEDPGAPPLVRAAGAWALAQDAAHAPSSAFAAARALAAAPAEDAHLRAEALHLLAEAPAEPATGAQDRALATATLAETASTPELALAAARLALQNGADRSAVARALASRADPSGVCARAARTLEGAP